MANIHFGNSGDVWKHLVLGEVLAIERPLHVWESHAGNAWYPLSHGPARDQGVYAFRQLAVKSVYLAQSAYARTLNELAFSDSPLRYPGSPYLAMRLCQYRSTDFIFCDTDAESLADIRDVAARLGIDDDRLRLVQNDGMSTLATLGAKWASTAAASTFVHIDPYDPGQNSLPGFNALDLLCRLSVRGMKCVLWAGYNSVAERDALFKSLHVALSRAGSTAEELALWCGDVDFTGTRSTGFAVTADLISCVVIGSHLEERARIRCDELGQELANRYGSLRRGDRCEAISYTSFLVADMR